VRRLGGARPGDRSRRHLGDLPFREAEGGGHLPARLWISSLEALAGMLRPGNANAMPPPTTSRSAMRRWRRSPRSIGIARRS
jgi:hypothetical protein